MRKMNKGFTLAEVLMVTVMVAVIMGALAYMFQVVVASWSTQGARSGLGVGVNKAVEEMARGLRNAQELGSLNSDEIRFTTDGNTYYIYYLYSPSDHYPSQFTQTLYQVKKATLTGGIGGTFTYGSGDFITRDVQPPPASELSWLGPVVTIDLSASRGVNTIRAATKVRSRNI